MNREQRRAMAKHINMMQKPDGKYAINPALYPGDKVLIDANRIGHLYKKGILSDKFYQFVQANKHREFTVVYDSKHPENPVFVSLAEDVNKPKWLFMTNYLRLTRRAGAEANHEEA